MTCIVGLVDSGQVWLGGDSAASGGYSLTVRADPKVFTIGAFVMGFTTSFRMGQLLRYQFTPPLHDPAKDTFTYMVADFVEGVRTCLKNGGYTRVESNVERGGQFLVGYQGRLFTVESDFQIGESLAGYDAVGSGQDLALGALYATSASPPAERIQIALQAASEFNSAVRGPFTVVTTPALVGAA